jgi:hypothetical protein
VVNQVTRQALNGEQVLEFAVGVELRMTGGH